MKKLKKFFRGPFWWGFTHPAGPPPPWWDEERRANYFKKHGFPWEI